MPRNNRVFKKRINVGGKKPDVKHPTTPVTTNNTNTVPSTPVSASMKKLKDNNGLYDTFQGIESKNILIDLSILNAALLNFAVCKNCGQAICLKTEDRAGIVYKLELSCKSCTEKHAFYTSTQVESHGHKLYATNLRFVYALRSIGMGRASGEVFCGIMNLPPPPEKFRAYVNVLLESSKAVCEASMKSAAEEAATIEEARDIAVALDGTWQKRGYQSLNGVVTATSVDTGKVIDREVLSKHCRCKNKLDNEHVPFCSANYSGTSGGMEVSGVAAIFQRSEDQYNLRYTRYLGDGDSKGHVSVVELNPYKNTPIEKLECIGHVQKRMGTRLFALKSKSRGVKLSDGKKLGGRNRLTDVLIVQIQRYYGLAIRRNVSDLQAMKQAVWASYFHLLSSDDNPQHGLCPPGDESWCKYRKAEATGDTYIHSKHQHIPSAIMTTIKPIFRDLADPKLLQKCIHGKTQNPNESVNSVIWSLVPKHNFVELQTLKLGVELAISQFNMGHVSKCLILQQCGIQPEETCVSCFQTLDDRRVKIAQRKHMETQKKARISKLLKKKRLEEAFAEAEGVDNPSYQTARW